MSKETSISGHDGAGKVVEAFERLSSRWVIEDAVARRKLAQDTGQQVNQLLRAIRDRAQPDQPHEELQDLIEQTIAEVDFGLLRDAVERRADDLEPLAASIAKAMVANPVVIANTVSILPVVVNAAMRLTGKTAAALQMPSEMKASAVFSLLGQLDNEAAAQALNTVTEFVVELHQGNLVLGRDEPRLREVFTRLAEGVLDHLDEKQAAAAVVAVAEDFETVAGAIGDLAYRDPDLPVHVLSATVDSLQAVARGIADVMTRLEQLPDERLDGLAETIEERFQPLTVARLINSAASLAERVVDRDPALPGKMARRVVDAVDAALMSRVAAKLAGPLFGAAWDAALERAPGSMGQWLASALREYNRHLDEPARLRERMRKAVEPLDAAEVERAVERTLGELGPALSERPELLMAVLRPATPLVLRLMRMTLMNALGRSARLPRFLGGRR